jgi:hypothetical protein
MMFWPVQNLLPITRPGITCHVECHEVVDTCHICQDMELTGHSTILQDVQGEVTTYQQTNGLAYPPSNDYALDRVVRPSPSELPPGPMLLGDTPPGPHQLWHSTLPSNLSSSSLGGDSVEIGYTRSAGDLLTMATGRNGLQTGGSQYRVHSMSLDDEAMHQHSSNYSTSCLSAPSSRMLSRDASPLRNSALSPDSQVVATRVGSLGSFAGLPRGKLRPSSSAEEREQRQKAAADKLSRLESNCLLDFEVKNMGLGKGMSSRIPVHATPLRPPKVEDM